jgi:hypothetical protein
MRRIATTILELSPQQQPVHGYEIYRQCGGHIAINNVYRNLVLCLLVHTNVLLVPGLQAGEDGTHRQRQPFSFYSFTPNRIRR